MYAMNHGLDRELAANLGALVFSTVVVSIVVHGISVTPLMAIYERTKPGGEADRAQTRPRRLRRRAASQPV